MVATDSPCPSSHPLRYWNGPLVAAMSNRLCCCASGIAGIKNDGIARRIF